VRQRDIRFAAYITCCILHVIQSRARWYATVPLREKQRSHYWADHLPGRLCVRSASLHQSIVKRTKQPGLSHTDTDSVSRCAWMHRIWTRFHFNGKATEITRIVHSRKAEVCQWIAQNYMRKRYGPFARIEILQSRTVGCLLYKKILSGFRPLIAERKHFPSLSPSLSHQ